MKAKPVLLYTVVPDGLFFTLHANGKPLKTPAGLPLSVPTERLAKAMLAEWQAQKEKINPHTMPLTQLATTAIDRVNNDMRAAIIEELANYAQTELICFRAEHPQDLTGKQTACWDPLLRWVQESHGLKLAPVTGLAVPPTDREKAKTVADGFDLWKLTLLQQAVAVTGSFVIGLALATGHLTAEEAFQAAELDALHQAERWGQDAEAIQRHKNIRDELSQVQRCRELLS